MDDGPHCERISAYCALTAERIGADAGLLATACRVHDIGMASSAGTNAHLPGLLTHEQHLALQAHTTVGHAMLADASPTLDCAAQIALTHHERYDGTGYPSGLAGEAIPLSGRIVGVADAFDALTTDRPYRSAISIEQACEVLRAERGRHFDPQVIDAFLASSADLASVLRRIPAPILSGPGKRPAPTPLTLAAAAAALDISVSRLRRWADDGRIESERTPGGHRRFPAHAVYELAAQRRTYPNVKPISPPEQSTPVAAEVLAKHGPALVARAASQLYGQRPSGWFASHEGTRQVHQWLSQLSHACAAGQYATAQRELVELMTVAQTYAVTLLERHAFLERLGAALLRALIDQQAPREELVAMRRLMVAFQQTTLEAHERHL